MGRQSEEEREGSGGGRKGQGEAVHPQNFCVVVLTPVPGNISLFGDRVSQEVIKVRRDRWGP